jgi:tRNA(fMet)-specific endonuclease VapC
VAPFEERAGRAYGSLRAQLQADGTPIDPLDTLIAGHALSLGMTLVTNNTREFSRVPGLRIENWISA